jgi:hypothetical protein
LQKHQAFEEDDAVGKKNNLATRKLLNNFNVARYGLSRKPGIFNGEIPNPSMCQSERLAPFCFSVVQH